MTLYMETTKIKTSRTIGQIQALLAESGCTKIMTEYEQGEVSTVTFCISINDEDRPFRLPCRWRSLFQVINGRRKRAREENVDYDRAQSKRVAWRQILRWVQAQMALVDTEMVTVIEVFMPYVLLKNNKTLYESIEGNNFKMLEDKSTK